MSQKGSPAMVGAFVLGAILLCLAGIIMLGSKGLFHRTYPFVSFFQHSVNGLNQGAAVKYKGVSIGSVDEIRLPLATGTEDSPVLVFFSIDAEKLRSSSGKELGMADLRKAIDAGLRARLEQESFVTGLLYVSIAYLPGSEASLHESIEGVSEIPTAPSEIEEVTGQIKALVDRFSKMDLAGLVDDLHSTILSVKQLLGSEDVEGTWKSLDRTLAGIGDAAASVDREIGPLVESLRAAADEFRTVGQDLQEASADSRRTMNSIEKLASALERSVETLTQSIQATLAETKAVLDPSSPPLVRLEQTLTDLSAMARAARAFLETLERDPSALLRGKGRTEEPR